MIPWLSSLQQGITHLISLLMKGFISILENAHIETRIVDYVT